MKRLIASVVLVVALLTSGVVVTQSSLVGTAYADDGWWCRLICACKSPQKGVNKPGFAPFLF